MKVSAAVTRVDYNCLSGDEATLIDISIVGDDIPMNILDLNTNKVLRLIIYGKAGSSANSITHRGASGSTTAYMDRLNVAKIAPTTFFTHCRTTPGDLKLITWRLNSDGSFFRFADSGSATGLLYEINSGALDYPHRNFVMTTVRDGRGNKLVRPCGAIQCVQVHRRPLTFASISDDDFDALNK